MTIKEKYAIKLQQEIQNGASQSDIIFTLCLFIDEEVDDKTRYDFDDFAETFDRFPDFDGHTSKDVIKRLLN